MNGEKQTNQKDHHPPEPERRQRSSAAWRARTAATPRDDTFGADLTEPSAKRAVIYLRVSTPSQVMTDYNPEGISLPAQREACQQKAASLGADIVREFVEPGRSATNIENRPVFQEMLAWIKSQRNIDYIIVYQFNRIFRNTIDAGITKRDLKKYGTRVVPTIMDLGEGPESDMVESIMHAVGEYQSKANGADISYKMAVKARNGGTLGRARLGYVNTRDRSEGRNIGIVVFDEERAPLMKAAFELYASGDYTMKALSEELTARGLRTRAGRYPAGPVSTSKLNSLLRDPYYIGYITYKDEIVEGRHESLIDDELFDRVQVVLAERSGRGVRNRRHQHYLKGSLWCGRCHDQGHEARIIFQWSHGNGGKYLYFFCRRRQQKLCDAPYLEGDALERAVLAFYGTLQLSTEVINGVRDLMQKMLFEEESATKMLHTQLTAELTRLDAKEENLVDLVADGNLVSSKAKQRLGAIQMERRKVQTRLNESGQELAAGAALIEDGLQLLSDPQGLYRRFAPGQRQLLNQAIFEKLYVEEDGISGASFNPPFGELLGVKEALKVVEPGRKGSKGQKRVLGANPGIRESRGVLTSGFFGDGVSKGLMVGAEGLEPSLEAV